MHAEFAHAAADFFAKQAPLSRTRDFLEAEGEGFDRTSWTRFCEEMGVAGMLLPEVSGGSGVGVDVASVVAEEAGKVLYGGPYLSTWAATLLAPVGAAKVLDRVLEGERVVAVSVDTGMATAHQDGEQWRLEAQRIPVEFVDACDVVLVVAETVQGPGLFAVEPMAPGVTREETANVDLTRRMGLLTLHEAVAVRCDEDTADLAAVLPGVRRALAVLRAAEALGSAGRILDMTVEYAKVREQFGRPIAGFQAVKHNLAELYMDFDAATAAVAEATRLLEESPDGAATAATVLSATIIVEDAFLRISHEAIQVHGGIGFTWEHDAHLFYRRALASAGIGGTRFERLGRLTPMLKQLTLSEADQAADTSSSSAGAELEAFRKKAHAWLSAAMRDNRAPERRPGGSSTTREGLEPAKEFQREMYAAGLAGFTYPTEYGGTGQGAAFEDVFYEETRSVGAGEDKLFRIGIGMIGPVILAMGTEEQKQRYIPPLLRGDEVWCELFSEPGSGSDMAAARTSAVEDGDFFVVTGQKVWTSNAHLCEFGLLLARTDPHAPKHQGLTMLIVPMGAEGVDVRPLRQITGETDFNEVFLDSVRVPKENVLGVVGEGWQVARRVLMHERMAMGTSAVRRVSMSDLLEIAQRTAQDDDPLVQAELAEQLLREARLRLYFEYLSGVHHRRPLASESGSIAKALMTRTMQQAGVLAARLLGAGAAVWTAQEDNGDLLRRVLAAQAFSIAGGSDNILRNLVGERVLGLPRD